MVGGVAECHNGHQFCIQCAVTWTAEDFGIRRLKWSSSIHETLTWSRFKCCICGVRGPLRRSSVTDAAVAALPVRCGFTALQGLACRWSGRNDEFETHQHVFTNPDQDQPAETDDHPSRCGRKRPNSDLNTDSYKADGQGVKQRRYQIASSDEKNEDEVEFQRVQTADIDNVPASAFPDTNASGESVEGLVLDTTVPHFNRTGIVLDAGLQREDEWHITQTETQAVQTAGESIVRDEAVPGDDVAESTNDTDQEESESWITDREDQPLQSPTAGDDREPAILDDDIAATIFREDDEQHVINEQFHAVRSALQSAGLAPKPTVPPIDRATKMIYDVTARVVRRVIKTFKPSTP